MGRLLKAFAKNQLVSGAAVLALLLAVLFYPVVLGKKSLLLSSGTVASILPSGAYQPQAPASPFAPRPTLPARSNDPGAAAWFAEPSYKLLHDEILGDRCVPLWNPYNGFGVPLLANMQSQPFFPLTALAWLCPGPWSVSMYLLARLFAAGLLMFMFLRLFVSHLPALAGGVAFMLTGYLILFLNMPELSVALTMPGVFWAIETAMRQPCFKNAAMIALGTAFCLIGGMPETSMLVLLLALVYALLRIIYGGSDRRTIMLQIRCYVLGSALGCMLAAPQVLPFVEYMGQSFTGHQAGHAGMMPGSIAHGDFALHFLPYLLPLAFGPVALSMLADHIQFFGFNGYLGVCLFMWVLIGALSLLARLPSRSQSALRATFVAALFFLVVIAVALLKKFGVPPVQWLGNLPLLNLVVYWKYADLPLAFAACALAGIGLDAALKRTISLRWVSAGLALSAGFLLYLVICDQSSLGPDPNIQSAYWAQAKRGFELLTLSFALVVGARYCAEQQKLKSLFEAAAVALVVLELSTFTVVPILDRYHALPDASSNPYAGARYIDYLRQKTSDCERVMGLDGVLFPNWSSAYGIFDVRDLDAMYPTRYLRFVRNFAFGEPDGQEPAARNITTRFNGVEPCADFVAAGQHEALWRRFFALSSVRYLLSTHGHLTAPPNPVLDDLLAQNQPANPGFVRKQLTFDGASACYALYQHPFAGRPVVGAANTLRYDVTVPPGQPYFGFAVGIDPRKHAEKIGDGALFKLSVARRSTRPETVFAKSINPIDNQSDRQYFQRFVDMRKFAGEDVTLIFTVEPGLAGDNRNDWAQWLYLQWMPAAGKFAGSAKHEGLAPVYSDEIDIHRFDETLPRAAFFERVRLVNDGEEALALLRAADFSIWDCAIVESDGVSRSLSAAMESSASDPRRPLAKAAAQRITQYTPLVIRIETDTKLDGLLVLNDTNFVGWKAFVDGGESKIVNANYLFRGVFIPAGKHKVEFRYEPVSFPLGLALAGIALAVMIGVVRFEYMRDKC